VPYKIAITGHFRTGKDTFADMLTETLNPPTVKLHFGDALKEELAEMVWDYTSPDIEYADWKAEFLSNKALNGLAFQWWGEWRRQKVSENYWINHFLFQERYRGALIKGANISISDMRHVNEAEWCRKEGFYLVRIVGPCRAEGERRDPAHASEVHVDELEVDLVLPNTGSLNTLKEIAEGMPSHIALTHATHYHLAKNNA
jgi:hypothetical protein